MVALKLFTNVALHIAVSIKYVNMSMPHFWLTKGQALPELPLFSWISNQTLWTSNRLNNKPAKSLVWYDSRGECPECSICNGIRRPALKSTLVVWWWCILVTTCRTSQPSCNINISLQKATSGIKQNQAKTHWHTAITSLAIRDFPALYEVPVWVSQALHIFSGRSPAGSEASLAEAPSSSSALHRWQSNLHFAEGSMIVHSETNSFWLNLCHQVLVANSTERPAWWVDVSSISKVVGIFAQHFSVNN